MGNIEHQNRRSVYSTLSHELTACTTTQTTGTRGLGPSVVPRINVKVTRVHCETPPTESDFYSEPTTS